jgi:hypothetical protein
MRPRAGPRQSRKLRLERLEDRITPGFLAPLAFDAGVDPVSVAVADFNGDGVPDLAVANFNSFGKVSVLLGKGDGTFLPAQSFPTGYNSNSVAVGDFNGDGTPDLAVANQGSNNVSVLLGKGDGTFQTAQTFTAGPGPRSVAVADFNGDGRPDLAVAGGSMVSVLLGQGDGTFLPAQSYGAGFGSRSVAVGDFNGDGKPDLAVANEGTTPLFNGTVSVLLGQGDGTFLPALSYAAGSLPVSVAVGDFNGDGKLDLAVANQGTYPFTNAGVSVLLGQGDGTFQTAVHYAAEGLPVSVAVGDFNGDGKPDLAVANDYGVSVLRGQGDGTFLPAQTFPAAFHPSSVAVGDFNGDNTPDLAVTSGFFGNPGKVSVLLGKGDGTFPAAPHFPAGAYPESVAVGDFNGDGTPDLAVANDVYPNGTVSVLLGKGDGSFLPAQSYAAGNRPTSVAVGDFNNDGKLDLAVADYLSSDVSLSSNVSVLLGKGDGTFLPAQKFTTGAGRRSVAVGDFNGDGKLDLAAAGFRDVYDPYSGYHTIDEEVDVLLGQGDGTFQKAVAYPAGSYPDSVAVGDFNADGKPDLAVANYGNVSVLLGKGEGTFQPAVNYADGGGAVAVGDFKGDGKLDLVTASVLLLGNGDGTFQPAMNHGGGGGAVAVGDFNADGFPDLAVAGATVRVLLGQGDGTFQTFLPPNVSYVAGIFASPVAVGDFNGDGFPDLATVSNGVSILLNDATWSMSAPGAADRPVGSDPKGPAPPSLSLPVAAVAAFVTGQPQRIAPREAAPPAPGLAPGLVDARFAAPRGEEPARAAPGLVLARHAALSRTRWQPLFDDLDLLEQARAPLPWEEV